MTTTAPDALTSRLFPSAIVFRNFRSAARSQAVIHREDGQMAVGGPRSVVIALHTGWSPKHTTDVPACPGGSDPFIRDVCGGADPAFRRGVRLSVRRAGPAA